MFNCFVFGLLISELHFSFFAAETSAPAFVLYRIAAFRMALCHCAAVLFVKFKNAVVGFEVLILDVQLLSFQIVVFVCLILQIRNSISCFQNVDFRIDISHFAAAPSSPAFVLYRVAAFRIALGSLRFSLFYVV